jgi:ribosomal protein S18 acetylase RimI-like enzyme
MIIEQPTKIRADISVDHVTRLDEADLDSLAKATENAIFDGTDSSWRGRPSAERLKAFWNGVALSPQRHLVIARLEGKAIGAVQIVQAGPLSEVGPEVATLDNFFLDPAARGRGLARRMIRYAEEVARAQGIVSLDLVIREDRTHAASIFEGLGYRQWARKDTFRLHGDGFQAGLYFTKVIDETAGQTAEQTRVA